MYVRTIQHLNNSKEESEKQFAVYGSEKHVTLKQGPGHQTWYELVNPKQGYNHAQFKKPHLNSVHEKANNEAIVKSGKMSIISFE